MGQACHHPGAAKKVIVRVDGQYDYVDHVTGKRCVLSLDQSAVHSLRVEELKQQRRRRRGNLLKACALGQQDPMAQAIVDAAMGMAARTARETDVLDRDWPTRSSGFKGPPLETLLQGANDEIPSVLISLAQGVQEVVEEEPTLVRAQVPTRIFGDLHGQFRDLLLWLQDFGFPHAHGPSYVFNGDWVDRGAHQLETVALVFALKLAFPDKVFLVRGNHEFRDQNVHMGPVGFKASCGALGQEGDAVFEAFQGAFDMLPLGCLVGEKILVVHGGLGDGRWSLESLASVQRPLNEHQIAEKRHVYNVLWSDPIPETVEQSFGVHDSPRDGHRRLVLSFGKDVTEAFCARNNIEMVVRSHQEKRGGCGYEVMHGNRLVRVFSARDYEGQGNDGAMLKVRWSRGKKLVVRPQLLRSLTKVRDPGQVTGEVAAPPMADTLFGCVSCEGVGEAEGDEDQSSTESESGQEASPGCKKV
mmetsp:Transcript_105943/g.326994  ORF Transcript_105943/g.326994 Transcript_105943/m.326994 type:complete len:472 (-) Transcript_105943:155-1570(-)